MDTRNHGDRRMEGFTLLQVVGALTVITVILAMGVAIYLSAKSANEKTLVIEDAESVANSLNVFYLNHGVSPETFVAVAASNMHDPWANFYIYDSCSEGAQALHPTKRAIFIQNQEGRVFADMDGDGTIDVSTAHLDPHILRKLKAMSVGVPAPPNAIEAKR